MYINYKGVAISGAIAGILIGAMAILGFCCYPVDILVLLGAGALAVHLSAGTIKEQDDLLVNGALAGLAGGLVGGILYSIVSTLLLAISSLSMGSQYSETYRTICGTAPPSPLASGVMGVVCCLPVFVVTGAILGALGALAYRSLKK